MFGLFFWVVWLVSGAWSSYCLVVGVVVSLAAVGAVAFVVVGSVGRCCCFVVVSVVMVVSVGVFGGFVVCLFFCCGFVFGVVGLVWWGRWGAFAVVVLGALPVLSGWDRCCCLSRYYVVFVVVAAAFVVGVAFVVVVGVAVVMVVVIVVAVVVGCVLWAEMGLCMVVLGVGVVGALRSLLLRCWGRFGGGVVVVAFSVPLGVSEVVGGVGVGVARAVVVAGPGFW